MITGVHTLIYAADPAAARAFCRDVLGLHAVDTGGGWLIFRTGPSELGVHPSSWGPAPDDRSDQRFDVSFMCDDLAATMADLAAKGATFTGGVVEQEWGRAVRLAVPGAGEVTLYQPAYDPPAFAS